MSESSYFEASEERTVCLLFDSTDVIEDDHNHSTTDEIVGKTKIWVSKELLTLASPVFRKMFYGQFRENAENSKPIYLPSKKLDEFMILLKCLVPYADRKEVDQSNVRVIFPLAHEYQIELLISKCVECFKNGLSKLNIGSTYILNDVPFFAKYGLTSLIEYIIPYAAALDVTTIDECRKRNAEKMSADHPFYFAVYEAKAHRLSLEQQFKQQPYEYSEKLSSGRVKIYSFPNEEYSTSQTRMTSSFHRCNDYENLACLCGYKFARELLHF